MKSCFKISKRIIVSHSIKSVLDWLICNIIYFCV